MAENITAGLGLPSIMCDRLSSRHCRLSTNGVEWNPSALKHVAGAVCNASCIVKNRLVLFLQSW